MKLSLLLLFLGGKETNFHSLLVCSVVCQDIVKDISHVFFPSFDWLT